MKTCRKCGGSGPFPVDRTQSDGTHSQCKECHRVRAQQRRTEHPEITRATNRRSMSKARLNHPERVRATNQKWWSTPGNREAVNERRRPNSRAYYQRNKDRWLAYKAQRRARKANANGHATPEQIRARIAFFGGCCAYCKGPYEHLDHVIALSRGGTNWPANLRPACSSCNLRKHTKTQWKSM